MQLEDYFNFLRADDIRLKGTRVGIETILYDFIYHCRTPEEIADSYHTINTRASLCYNSLLLAQ